MRRTIPKPCSGPRTSSVLRIIRASVPGCTSSFLVMASPMGFPYDATTGQKVAQGRVSVTLLPPRTGSPMIEVRGLSKSYGALVAVDSLSFAVQPGEVLGLVGPNGAG